MARTEARITVDIWDDDDFCDLEGDEQRLFMFLLSQSDLAHDGVIPLRERRWASKWKGKTVADVERCLKGLEAARFLVVDLDTEEVLVRSFMRNDKVYRQPNVMHAAVDHVPLISSRRIVEELIVEVERILAEPLTEHQAKAARLMAEALAQRLAQASTGKPKKGTPNPSDNPSRIPSGISTADAPGERGVPQSVSSDSPFPESPNVPPPAARPAGKRAKPSADEAEMTGGRLVAEWLERCEKRPPNQTIVQVGKHLKSMLAEGIDPDDLRRGLTAWRERGLAPVSLSSVVNEVMNAAPRNPRAAPSGHKAYQNPADDSDYAKGFFDD